MSSMMNNNNARLSGSSSFAMGMDSRGLSRGASFHDVAYHSRMRQRPMSGGPRPSPSVPHMRMAQSSPRMVSLTSMASANNFGSMGHSKKPSSTPYDSLKQLVRNKNKRTSSIFDTSSDADGHRVMLPSSKSVNFLDQSQSFQRTQSHSSFQRPMAPSHHYQQQQQHQQQQAPLHKRQKVDEPASNEAPLVVLEGDSDLHQACVAGNTEAIANLVAQDRVQAARAVRITTTKQMYNMGTYQLEPKQVQENYAFALNLAIRNKVDSATLELLSKAAPGVLSTKDGDAQECSLSVLFKTSPEDMHTADQFLLKNPDCARITDRKGNTPLHVACQNGASLDTIRHLVILYPEALFVYNNFGENPLMLAQRSSNRCSEDVATYLWEKQAEAF